MNRFNSFIRRFIAILSVVAMLFSFTSCDYLDEIENVLNDGTVSNDSFKRDENDLTITYLDVGQGDSEFIEFPDGTTMLIDTGVYAKVDDVIDYIEELGYSRIDYLVLTHHHADHMGGAATIIRTFDIGKIYIPKIPDSETPTTSYYSAFVNAVAEEGLKLTRGKNGVNIIDSSELSVEMFAPISDSYEDTNNYSIGIKIVYGDTSFLFFGDGEKLVENEVLESGFDVSANVYKASHHGSSTSSSSEFLDAVSPEYAVISCGEDNQYGHPHKETLEAFKERGITYFRTDKDGNIIAQSDGSTIEFYTEN